MSVPVVLRREASRDVEEIREYLNEQRTGLGQAFLYRLNELLGLIGDFPEMFGVLARNVRAARLRRFTYVVYYRVHADRVEVLTVLHGSRDDSVWRARTRDA